VAEGPVVRGALEDTKPAMVERRTILVVEDDPEIAALVAIHLRNEGFGVILSDEGHRALAELEAHEIHLVILDVMLPGIDGLEVCRRIRAAARPVPIIFLTARGEDMDKILGLSTGADDYLTKPFNVLELIARVRSQLRRYLDLNPRAIATCGPNADDQLVVGDLTLDRACHTVRIDERYIDLTATEFQILALLAGHAGRVFGAEEIFRKIWADRYYDSNNTVMVHIRHLRQKIERDPGRPARIRTVWGVGYRYER
jgi:two-component system, OmpR family, response regulator VanR